MIKFKNKLTFSKKEIISVLDKYIHLWKTGLPSGEIFVPLLNFKSEIKEINLINGISIKVFSDDEKSKFWNSTDSIFYKIDIKQIAETSHVMFYKGKDFLKCNDILECAITVFHIVKTGHIGIEGIQIFPELMRVIMSRGQGTTNEFRPSGLWFAQKPYEFNRGDVYKFHKIFKRVSANKFEIWNTLKIPLSRFNIFFNREKAEDKIIDMAICLESCLLFGTKDELKYRLSIRGSQLCCLKRKPKKTFKFLILLYDVRSKIVHDGESFGGNKIRKIFNKSADITEHHRFLDELESLVRDILQELISRLSKESNLEIICKDLDSQILSSIKP